MEALSDDQEDLGRSGSIEVKLEDLPKFYFEINISYIDPEDLLCMISFFLFDARALRYLFETSLRFEITCSDKFDYQYTLKFHIPNSLASCCTLSSQIVLSRKTIPSINFRDKAFSIISFAICFIPLLCQYFAR